MKKIKPVVIGYVQTHYSGFPLRPYNIILSKPDCADAVKIDIAKHKEYQWDYSKCKSKFRPVYDYGVSHDQN